VKHRETHFLKLNRLLSAPCSAAAATAAYIAMWICSGSFGFNSTTLRTRLNLNWKVSENNPPTESKATALELTQGLETGESDLEVEPRMEASLNICSHGRRCVQESALLIKQKINKLWSYFWGETVIIYCKFNFVCFAFLKPGNADMRIANGYVVTSQLTITADIVQNIWKITVTY